MSRSFILINDNSTKLSHITNNPSSSDLTKDKKNKTICINTQSLPQQVPKKGPIFKICKPPTKCCNLPSYNKTILNSNLHTYEDLNDITTIQLNNPNALDFTTPIYNNYTIDPDGVLFGESPCDLENYLQFRQPLVNPYPNPQTPSNVVASVLGTYDDPSIRISWDYGTIEPGITVVSYSIYGYDVDPDTNTTTPFGPFIIPAYTYTYLLTTSTYNLQLSHFYYFQVQTNTSFNTSNGGTSNTVLLAYAPEPTTVGPVFTLYSYTPPLTFLHLLQLTQKKYEVLITWTASSIDTGADISSYTIHITGNNGYDQTYTIPNTTSYSIPGLDEFTTYTISITANNIVGSSQLVSTNYTIGINFNFNYKTTNTAIIQTDVLNHLPFITTDNKLTINHANVYVNIQTDIDPNKKLVSVEIPQESFTFADNTTTNDGLSFQSSNYYFSNTGNVTEINLLFFGNNGTQSNIIPLSRGGTQFGLSSQAYSDPESNVILTISNSDKPYILGNTSFDYTFRKLNHFNSDISAWVDISKVTKMGQMFLRTKEFNQDISGWDVSNVKEMSYMFNDAIAFNNGDTGNNALHPLKWTTTAVTSVAGMFNGASKFNQDISTFVLTKVTGTLEFMFYRAYAFNQDINGWDVSKVTAMNQMFYQASSFNQDISAWNVTNVKRMESMMFGASNFNNGGGVGDSTRPMTGWNVGSVTNHTNFANGSGLYYTGHPTGNIQPNYWEYSPTNPTNVSATYNTGSYNNYSVRLIWDTVIGANSYNVKLTTNNTTDTITSTGTSPYTFTGLNVEANTYSFSVQAVNSQGGSSGYSSATIPTSAVGTASATSGIDSLSINVADITLTGSNYGPFYKISTTPTTGVNPTTLSDLWTTSELLTNITCTRDNLITNFNYSFTITSYNIAGSVSASSASITNFKPVNNFMFSYTATALPPLGTSGGDATQQQREGIFNYLPFFKGTSAATGTLTLDSLLYTTNNYITWTTTSPYTVTVNFPKKYTDGTTDLWTYINTTNPGNIPQAGIAIDGLNTTINPYYRDMCQSISYNNFSSIPISNKGLFYIEGGYSKIFNITNNSIPIFLQGMSINLFTYITPSSTSSINLSNWDLSNATKSLDFAYSSNFSNVDINISNWDVRNITSAILFRSTQVKSTMPALNWNFSNLSGSAFPNSFNGSNFNSPLNFKFSGTSQFRLERMFNGANSFNQNISTTYDSNGTPVYWDVSNVTDMANMFNTATNFNQNIGNWNVSNVGNMSQMFYKNETFNQDSSNWDVSNVTDMSLMFGIESTSGGKFNQNISNWNVSKVNTMNEMFRKSINFNNGELGYTSISGANITPGSSYYTSSTSVLTCPSATCSASGLTTSDVVIITTSSIVYAAQITGITDTTLTLFPAYTSNIISGSITSITKQVVGTSPLTWNLRPGGVSLNQMFKECAYFNQRLLAKDGGSPWNMTNVSNVSSMFLGSSAKKNLFNNGYLITDTTHPLNWAFTATPTSTDWHTNCVLTPENGVTTPTIY